VGNLVRLRGVEPEDWEVFHGFDENSVDMRRMDKIYPPRSAARQREWTEQVAVKKLEDDRFQLAIESLADGALVGSVSTALIDHRAGRFSYGIAIGGDHKGRGYGSDAVPLLLNFMFGERRFHAARHPFPREI